MEENVKKDLTEICCECEDDWSGSGCGPEWTLVVTVLDLQIH
jgi:hypothetical protein